MGRARVRFLCVNDVYTFEALGGRGGWPRALTMLRLLRQEAVADKRKVLVAANGDVLGGASLLEHSKGRLAVDCLNLLPVDFAVVGNHEFDYGTEQLEECVAASKFSWLAANVCNSQSNALLNGVEATRVISLPEHPDLRLGLFGLCTQATPSLSYPSDSTMFQDVKEAANIAVSSLEVKAQVIIGLTHLRLAEDQAVARELGSRVCALLGGHDHEPVAMQLDHTILFKCGQNAYWIGVLDVDIDFPSEKATLLATDLKLFLSWSMHSTHDTPPDNECLDLVARWQKEADRALLVEQGWDENDADQLDVVVAKLGNAIDTRSNHLRKRETSSANLLADAMFAYYKDADIDVAMINGGFIRGDAMYAAGTCWTRRTVFHELPFPRACCLLEILGVHLLSALEQQLRFAPVAAGCFPHLSKSGRLEYDASAPIGSMIRSFLIHGLPIDVNRRYRVAVTEFIASGGDDCSSWSYGVPLSCQVTGREGRSVSHVLLEYLESSDEPLVVLCEGRVRNVANRDSNNRPRATTGSDA